MHQPIIKGIRKKLGKLLTSVFYIVKPTPNQFNNRYAEKFPNPDHCQWQGGRLLTAGELEKITGKDEPANNISN